MGCLVALHIVAIWLVPWPTRWYAAQTWTGLVAVDLFAIYGIIWGIGRLAEGPQISEELKRPDKV
jgi:hypothetical protein